MARRGLWISVAAALVAAAVAGFVIHDMRANTSTVPGIGMPADVRLTDHRGQPFTAADLKGKPTAIFFGFTYCPEICPTTLLDMGARLQALGEDADRLNVVFVTIDPERDTPKQLAAYLSSFDPRIRGVSGTPDQIDRMAKGFRVYYRKVETGEGEYTMDHSTAVYLMDAKGRFVGPIGYQEPADRAVASLKRLIEG